MYLINVMDKIKNDKPLIIEDTPERRARREQWIREYVAYHQVFKLKDPKDINRVYSDIDSYGEEEWDD